MYVQIFYVMVQLLGDIIPDFTFFLLKINLKSKRNKNVQMFKKSNWSDWTEGKGFMNGYKDRYYYNRLQIWYVL